MIDQATLLHAASTFISILMLGAVSCYIGGALWLAYVKFTGRR